ncbi:MAG: TldD/PmbA family protein [Chloroflexi bacterium]|nr:TldD/PmbA family protein [Chloroflexota bacterium]
MSLDPNDLVAALNEGRSYWGDFAEIFAERRTDTIVVLDDGRLDKLSAGEEAGVGVRIFHGPTSAYVYTSDFSRDAIVEAMRLASAAAKQRAGTGETLVASLDRGITPTPLSVYKQLPDSIPLSDKVAIVRNANRIARGLGAEIRQVTASYQDYIQDVTIVNSLEEVAQDRRVQTVFSINVVASDGTILQTANESTAALAGFEQVAGDLPERYARIAGERALRMLRARPAPAGTMPIVCAAGTGGVLIHEAIGHGMEADFNLPNKPMSVFAGKVGQLVAHPKVTIVDDATIPNFRGSYRYDDEGVPGQRRLLIEKGILRNYMNDRKTARELGVAPNGGGRRQSFRHTPMPRMTNTFMLSGDDDPNAIIRSVEHGLLIKQMGGGQVNIVSGDFVFNIQEAYLIEKGQIAEPVRGATVIGNGPAILKIIDLVGNDSRLESRAGMCGKDGQGAPVGFGIPTLRVPEIVVGGIVPGMTETMR